VTEDRWARGHRRRVATALTITAVLLSWQTARALTAGHASTGAHDNAQAQAVVTAASPPAPPPAAPTAAPVPTPNPDPDAFAATDEVLLSARVQGQLPELANGCEVTSLSMLLSAVGRPADKMVLTKQQPTNPEQPVFAREGDFSSITAWGNPNRAFVGDVYNSYGYGIYHGPIAGLLETKVPGRSLDLSGQRFSDVLAQLRRGVPVMLWTTTSLRPPPTWVTWETPDGPIRATQLEHAVLLVGYTPDSLIINNPLTGRQEAVAPEPFIASWQQMGRQAVSVRPV